MFKIKKTLSQIPSYLSKTLPVCYLAKGKDFKIKVPTKQAHQNKSIYKNNGSSTQASNCFWVIGLNVPSATVVSKWRITYTFYVILQYILFWTRSFKGSLCAWLALTKSVLSLPSLPLQHKMFYCSITDLRSVPTLWNASAHVMHLIGFESVYFFLFYVPLIHLCDTVLVLTHFF